MGAARLGSWLVVLLFLAGAGYASVYTFENLKINSDSETLLSDKLDFQINAAKLNSAFPSLKSGLTVVVVAPTRDEAEIYASRLTHKLRNSVGLFDNVFSRSEDKFFIENGLLFLDLRELELRLSRLTQSTSFIESIVNSPNSATFFSELAENESAAADSALGRETLNEIYDNLIEASQASLAGRSRPFAWMDAVEQDSGEQNEHIRLIQANPVSNEEKLDPISDSIEFLNREIDALDLEFSNRVETFVTGSPALHADELKSVSEGIAFSLVSSFVLVALLLYSAYRSVFLATISLVSLSLTITFTSAFAAYTVGELNLISIAFSVLLVGLSLDFAIHLLLHIQERRAAGQSLPAAQRGAVHEVGPALMIAAPTTALAFFSFLPTELKGVADLGLIAGAGVLIAFVVCMTFLPAALGAFRGYQWRPNRGHIRSGFRLIEKISLPIAIIVIAMSIVSSFIVPKIVFDSDLMALRDPESQSVRGFNYLFELENSNPYRIIRIAPSQQAVAETRENLKHLDVVKDTHSLLDFVPEDQAEKMMLIDFAAGSILFALEGSAQPARPGNARASIEKFRNSLLQSDNEKSAELAAALTALIDANDAALLRNLDENIFTFWPEFVSRLQRQFNVAAIGLDDLPAPVVTRYKTDDGLWRVDILPTKDIRERSDQLEFISAVEAVYPDAGGGVVQAYKSGDAVFNAMVLASITSIVAIVIFLYLILRRPVMIAFIAAPLIFAATLTIAAAAYFDIHLNYANVIVLPLLIGIGVDNGIHLVLRQNQVDAGEDIYGTSTPRAIFFSSLTTVAAFGTLIISSHRGITSLGLLLSIAIVFTLICTLIALPAAYRLFENRVLRP